MEELELPQDFKELLKLLISKKTKFLLIGGYAVTYHGFPRYTGDIDLWVELSPANARAIVAALSEFGFDLPTLKPELFLQPGKIIRMGREPLRVEIMTIIDGVEFAEAYKNKVQIELEKGFQIPVISLNDLRQNKKASGRAKDLSDLEGLPEK
jgi:hypothetical protein